MMSGVHRGGTSGDGAVRDAGWRTADRWGHKRFLPCRIVDPAGPRCALYALRQSFWLVGVQLLDASARRIFGAIFPVIVAHLMRNTGRFIVAQGAVITGPVHWAALIDDAGGPRRGRAGFSAAFITLGAVAAIGAVICLLPCPETRQSGDGDPRPRGKTAAPASVIAAE